MRFLLLLLISFSGFCQDIFSPKNSEKYADYLLKSGQYELAAKEYERLVFFSPQNDTMKTMLLKSYRLANQTDLALERLLVIYPEVSVVPYSPSVEISKLYFTKRDWKAASEFWESNKSLPEDDKTLLKTTVQIFENNFQEARETIKLLKNDENNLGVAYKSILEKETHKKSPALAGMMSMILPGSGKAYSKNWKDGIVSLFFTAGMSFQAYRSFNKHGINNYRGWIYSGIGFGFYLGNIYGGIKSTKDYNRKKINNLQHEASNHFNLYF